MTKDIRSLIKEMPDLPTMPNVVIDAMNLIKDPKSNVNQLSEVISRDVSLTSQILKLVNSAYYGFPNQITTINKAIALLGLKQVNSLVMSVAMKPMLMTNYGKDLWEHCIRCAIASQIIAKKLGHKDTEEAFVMGLLHDIGKTLFQLYNKAAAAEVEKLVKLGADRIKTEKMLFGFTHMELGSELVNNWNLPLVISNCVRYHHDPRQSDMASIVGIVYIANRVTQEPLKYPVLDHDIIDILDFEVTDPMMIREEAYEKSESIINTLS
ncbi:MAG: HDOD domain-containing protein [Candidatus Gastranaerophilales bacterium]|nr:HDOD domain-containing protein [Candidatus Gastranaerophilales bacterium]